jgi:hypothetical protein
LFDHPIGSIGLAHPFGGIDRSIVGLAIPWGRFVIDADRLGIIPKELGIVAMRDGLAVVAKESVKAFAVRVSGTPYRP